jgi:hypothetical protein
VARGCGHEELLSASPRPVQMLNTEAEECTVICALYHLGLLISCCAETGYVDLLVVNLVIAHLQSSGLYRIELVNTINNVNSPSSSMLTDVKYF